MSPTGDVTLRPTAKTRLRRWRRDEAGSTAIEFAIVATPFLMFVFGLVGCCFYFFVTNSIENGMDQMNRLIRTNRLGNMTVADFKNGICTNAGSWIDCEKLQVFTHDYPNGWSQLNADQPQPCVQNGAIAINDTPGGDPMNKYTGTASDVVVVTACYKWDFTKKLPFLNLGNMNDGSMMMQTATAFRSEPYAGN